MCNFNVNCWFTDFTFFILRIKLFTKWSCQHITKKRLKVQTFQMSLNSSKLDNIIKNWKLSRNCQFKNFKSSKLFSELQGKIKIDFSENRRSVNFTGFCCFFLSNFSIRKIWKNNLPNALTVLYDLLSKTTHDPSTPNTHHW